MGGRYDFSGQSIVNKLKDLTNVISKNNQVTTFQNVIMTVLTVVIIALMVVQIWVAYKTNNARNEPTLPIKPTVQTFEVSRMEKGT